MAGTQNAGALAVVLQGDTAQFDSSMSKAAAAAERELMRIQRATQKAQEDNDRFVASIQREVDTFNMTRRELIEYEARLRGVSDQVQPLLARMDRMKDAQAAFTQSAEGARGLGAEMEKAAGHASGLTREVLVLAHEASQGNWKRLGGSLLVFGEYASSAGLSAVAATAGMAALAGMVLGVAVTMARGAAEAQHFRDALILTGNYAGQTAATFDRLARSIAGSTNGTIGNARGLAQQLVQSGAFGPEVIDGAGQAIARLERLTGDDSQKIVADFARMGEGVAKWAAEHDRSMHFITTGQYEQIRALEDSGRAVEAQRLLIEALNSSLSESDKQLGTFARWWNEVKKSASEAGDALASIGRGDNLDQTLKKATEDLRRLQQAAQGMAILKPGEWYRDHTGQQPLQQQIAAQQALVDHLRQTARQGERLAQEQADHARTAEEGTAARRRLDSMLEQARAAQSLQYELQKLNVEFDKAAKAGAPLSDADKQTLVDEVKRRHQPRDERKLDTEVQAYIKSLTDEGVKLRAEAANYEAYGKSIDSARAAVARFRTEQGDLKGASPQQKQAIIGAAENADAAEAADKEAKAVQAIREKVKALTDEATARAQSAREAAIAQALSDQNLKVLDKESDAYKQLSQQVRDAAAARYDAKVSEPAMQQWSRSIDDMVAKIDAETDALGQNALARQHEIDRAALLAKAEAEIAQYPEREAEIWQKLYDAIERVGAARDRAYATSRNAGTGATTALQKWYDDATNEAKNTEALISGTLNQASDAFVKFAQTGKLNMGNLFAYIEQQFLKMEINKMLAAVVGGGSGGSGLGGALFTMFTGSAGAWGSYDGSHADGLSYVPYDGYRAILHEGERVMTKRENMAGVSSAGGTQIHVGQGAVYNIGQGVSRAEVVAGIQQSNAAMEQRFKRLMRQERLQ